MRSGKDDKYDEASKWVASLPRADEVNWESADVESNDERSQWGQRSKRQKN